MHHLNDEVKQCFASVVTLMGYYLGFPDAAGLVSDIDDAQR